MMKRDELMELEELIRSKSYTELNEMERSALAEMCSNETEFLAVKQFYQSADAMKTDAFVPELNPELKSSLDAVFAAKHPLQDPIPMNRSTMNTDKNRFVNSWFVRIAAILVLVSTTVWVFLRNGVEETGNNQLAKNEIVKEGNPETAKTSSSSNKKMLKTENNTTLSPMEITTDMVVEEPRIEPNMVASSMMSVESQVESDRMEVTSFSAASRGLNADLYPQSLPSAPSLAQQKSEVLDLLTPMY